MFQATDLKFDEFIREMQDDNKYTVSEQYFQNYFI